MYLNLEVIGRLGKDPESRFTPAGTPVCSFSVATDRKYTGADGQLVKETTWTRISVFGKRGENCQKYLKKGSLIHAEGRLTPDKESGGPRLFQRPDGSWGSSYEMIANTVTFLSSASDSGSNGQHQPAAVVEEEAEPEL